MRQEQQRELVCARGGVRWEWSAMLLLGHNQQSACTTSSPPLQQAAKAASKQQRETVVLCVQPYQGAGVCPANVPGNLCIFCVSSSTQLVESSSESHVSTTMTVRERTSVFLCGCTTVTWTFGCRVLRKFVRLRGEKRGKCPVHSFIKRRNVVPHNDDGQVEKPRYYELPGAGVGKRNMA